MKLMSAAGVFSSIERSFRRRIAIHDKMLGRRLKAPAGVVPYVSARKPEHERIVGLFALQAGPWDAGAVREIVSVVDPELVFSAIANLRGLAGEKDGLAQTPRAFNRRPFGLGGEFRCQGAGRTSFPQCTDCGDAEGSSSLVLERRRR